MKIYRARRKTVLWTNGILVLIGLLCVFGIVFAEPAILYAVFLMFTLFRWYQILRVPIEVTIHDDGALEFRGVIGMRKIQPKQIERLKRVGRGIYIEHPEGTFNLYGNMEGIEELLAYMTNVNPNLERV
jgi:hypothetical protein